MTGLADFGTYLGSTLGIGSIAGGLLATMLFTIFFCLLPILIFTKGKSLIAEFAGVFMGIGFSVAVGWMDIWLFSFMAIAISLVITLKFTGKL